MRPPAPTFTALFRACLLVALLPAAALGQEFFCAEGAADSGPQLPGDVIRWCELAAEGRTVYHGSVWRWYRNGRRRAQEFYLDGVGEGEWASWYPNGRQSSLGFFTHGRKTGTWLYWNEAGRVRAEVTYGTHADQWIVYYPSGKRRATGKAVRSGKIGPWVYWDKKGKELARCDFGTGLAGPTSAGCRRIAEEVEPIGFSAPIPEVTGADGAVTLRLDAETHAFAVPPGWTLRAQGQVPALLEPEQPDDHRAGPQLQVRILHKNGRKLSRLVSNELVRLRESVARYGEMSTHKEQMRGGRAAITKELVYQPIVEPDSPLARTAGSAVYQKVTFIDASDRIVIMALLECHGPRQLKQWAPALTTLLAPLREPPPAPAPPKDVPPAPPPAPATPAGPFEGVGVVF